MIIVRSPLRITLGGGGTDLPSFYKKHGGICLTAAINQYVYITLHEWLGDDLIVKWAEQERVEDASHVKHPIVREALAEAEITGHGLEIVSVADIPAGTGLGSSSAFTCALVKALHLYNGEDLGPLGIAQSAQEIELDRLKEPIGKQDQYISAIGGARTITFGSDGLVVVGDLPISKSDLAVLEQNLLLFFTGYTRSASQVLSEQPPSENALLKVKRLGELTLEMLQAGSMRDFAAMLTQQWCLKRSWSAPIKDIDAWFELGLRNGALGGKLVGAGGGGFLMFYTEQHTKLRSAMQNVGLREVPFKFDTEGTTVVSR